MLTPGPSMARKRLSPLTKCNVVAPLATSRPTPLRKISADRRTKVPGVVFSIHLESPSAVATSLRVACIENRRGMLRTTLPPCRTSIVPGSTAIARTDLLAGSGSLIVESAG